MVKHLVPRVAGSRFDWPFSNGLLSASRDFDRMVNDVLGENTAGWQTPLSYWQEDDKLHFEAEVPGVTADDLDVVVHDNTLRIGFERKQPENRPDGYRTEFRYGQFERSISLPDSVDPDSVDASLSNGILHVTLSKRPELKPKRIEVKTT